MSKSCSVDGCDRKYSCRGLCATHAYRLRRYGDPMKLKEPHVMHGYSREKLYGDWIRIKDRVSNKKNPRYMDYGGRGIRMYKEWFDGYQAFRAYVKSNIGDRPKPEYTLDRIDNDRGYVPGNIRWASKMLQVYNRRSHNNATGYPGVKKDGLGFDANIRYRGENIFIGYFKTPEAAGAAYQSKKRELMDGMV